jgi:hypothetical protein
MYDKGDKCFSPYKIGLQGPDDSINSTCNTKISNDNVDGSVSIDLALYRISSSVQCSTLNGTFLPNIVAKLTIDLPLECKP